MKITVIKTGVYEINYVDEWDLDISPDTLALIQSGQHPDYGSVEEWAEAAWNNNQPATRSHREQGEVYAGDTHILEAAE